MYLCQHPDCVYHREGGPRESVMQFKGENLCALHLEVRQQQSSNAFWAMWEQHLADQRRIREAGQWAEPFKIGVI